MEAQALRAGTFGAKARARLQQSEYYDDLMLLSELDRRGRVRGAAVCELEEAIEFLRELAEQEHDGLSVYRFNAGEAFERHRQP